MRLEGEGDARSWATYLTQDEASSQASLSVGYENAVVVMPEASKLRVLINNELVMDVPIASSQAVQHVVVPIRRGLLRTGQNIIRFEAIQRHRTDCTVGATYELWTLLESKTTGLNFQNGTSLSLRGLEDLPAVGVDSEGTTTLQIIAPKVYRPEMRERLLHLVEMAALRGRYAHPVVKVFETDPGPAPVGTLKIFLGLASELHALLPAMPDTASTQALTLVTQAFGSPALIVSGPSWQDVDTAINIIAASIINNRPASRNSVETDTWTWPDAPLYEGDHSVTFADLGIPTQEFSGRRFRVSFAIALPADFYANYYGEAALYLDAAHTPAVLPGSHIDIYVNDKISSTMRITAKGEIFRKHPIRIPMRNFHPGINYVTFEAVLMTDADERCPPGGTLSETSRFVLFDTTALSIPNFGRIGRLPNLATLKASGFPIGSAPATFVLARQDPALYSAAGTLLARMARDAGEPIHAQFANAVTIGDPSTFFIGAIDQLPAGMLTRVGVSEKLHSTWQSAPAATSNDPQPVETPDGSVSETREENATEALRRRWAESLSHRSFLQTKLEAIKGWIDQTFNLSLSTLSLTKGAEGLYEPSQYASLLLAQGNNDRDGTWTVLTGRTEESLADDTARLTKPMTWPQVAGHVATLEASHDRVEIKPISSFAFVQTQAFSLRNLRLVAANWMSINILQYAALLVGFCIILGVATYFLLHRLGRKS